LANGKSWRDVTRKEGNEQLNSVNFTGGSAVPGGRECCFIRLVNVGNDRLVISAWKIFGSLIE
jgi:hypothetical protein